MPNPQSSSSGDNEWRIISCKSCERQIKLPADEEDNDMACPYCSAPVSGAPAPDPTSQPRGERQKRRSGAKEQAEPSWDKEPGGGESDDEDVNEYVEVDPNNPDGVRVRRVRRKRTLTPAEKVVRTIGVGFVGLAVISCLAILIIALVKGTGTASRDIEVAAELPERVQALIKAATKSPTISATVSPEEIEASVAVIDGFYEATNNAERLAYVRVPERVGKLMDEWHAKKPLIPLKIEKPRIAKKDLIDGKHFIMLAAELSGSGETRFFTLEQTLDSIKLDWEVSAQYQSKTWQEMERDRPTTPFPLRVNIRYGSFYDGQFFSDETDQCFTLTYPGNKEFKLYGYAKKDSPTYEAITTALDLQKPAWILNVRYMEGNAATNQVIIDGVEHRSFFYHADDANLVIR